MGLFVDVCEGKKQVMMLNDLSDSAGEDGSRHRSEEGHNEVC